LETLSGKEAEVAEFRECRSKLLAWDAYFVPLTVIACARPQAYRTSINRVAKSLPKRAEFIRREFREVQALYQERRVEAEPDSETEHPIVSTSGWTGRRSVKEQVITIRAFAPAVLQSLDELIYLHGRLTHNQEAGAAQVEALALLKRLHWEIGELLTAVNNGRPFKALSNKVRKLGQRLFSIGKETGELLLLGVPTLGATGVTLGVVKGLELISGFTLGETETAAVITIAGGTYGLQDAARRKHAATRPTQK